MFTNKLAVAFCLVSQSDANFQVGLQKTLPLQHSALHNKQAIIHQILKLHIRPFWKYTSFKIQQVKSKS